MDLNFLKFTTYENLIDYTNSFSDDNCIGTFKFGKVYKGVHYWGGRFPRFHVVKIWDLSDCIVRDNELRLMREITFLRNEKINCLPGVIKLCGYVMDGTHLASIYDCKALGSVHQHLSQDDFTWMRRIKVALWYAHLLSFFHQNPPCNPLALHNVDSSCILLDEDYLPKLCDFSFMTGGDIFPSSPESLGELSPKVDVFGYGLILLSLISKKAINGETVGSILPNGCWDWTPSQWDNSLCLPFGQRITSHLPLVHESFEHDPDFDASDVPTISSLVALCLHPSLEQRPSMEEVFKCLENLNVSKQNASQLAVKPRANAPWDF